ncbi:MAG: phosphatase PAP2 family protein [Gemmatimonadaceae bacterium]|nr:phosphatase PAP2 family protein [Gemmatimonadaceae bacterium]
MQITPNDSRTTIAAVRARAYMASFLTTGDDMDMIRLATKSRRALLLLGALVSVASTSASAQGSDAGSAAPDTAHRAHLFTRSDALLFGAFVAGAAAISPFDSRIAREIREPEAQSSSFASHAADAFNFVGDPGTLIVGAALYGVGRLGHHARVADLGLHATEAIVVSGGIGYLIKGLAGRQRPRQAGVNDPDDFSFGGGFGSGGGSSFPSGHATAAFALATVVTLETHRWSPRSTWYVAPAAFGTATLVGVARLYTNAHWASDVIMGAGVGTLTALKVVRFNHVTNPRNRVNRWLLAAIPTPAPGASGRGAMLVWSFAAPR